MKISQLGVNLKIPDKSEEIREKKKNLSAWISV